MRRNLSKIFGMMTGGVLMVGLAHAAVVVAEGERFQPLDDKGWKVTSQDDSYASHTYGGMWVSQGGLLGAPPESVGSVATQKVTIPEAGEYRVWSKYQAPPYFNFMHKLEIVQGGKTVYSYVYGKANAERMWSFSAGKMKQLWWFWGMDHDAAEAPKTLVRLDAGEAELRLITVANEKPAGDPMVDFIVLTTNPDDSYEGFKPYGVGSPFCLEALAATKLYLRFRNTTAGPAQVTLSRAGHFQPNYGGATMKLPDAPVAAGQWSPWVNIGPFCRLVHDEGIWITLQGAKEIEVQVARDAEGKDIVGDLTVPNGEAVSIPIDITWNKDKRVLASREHAARIVRLAKTQWRTANGGKKPKELLYYGAFAGQQDWVLELKDALGYNTLLPDKYDHNRVDGYFQHISNPAGIKAFAAKLPDRTKFRVLSFGDEISIGEINWTDPAMQVKFVEWLGKKGITRDDLGVDPAQAKLTDRDKNPRVAWYAQIFNEEERFGFYRELTQVAKQEIGPQVETGANYSPHPLPQYYGHMAQWVDIFKHNGMTMFWTEDYIFSVPQPPQIISWMFAMMHCATKYNKQKIHMYVMPHAPGQTPENLRRNMVFSIGAGARHIDNFWVAPEESFTENYIAWGCTDSFRVIHESIYDSAEAEPYQVGGKLRPARVAIVLSKATDHNEFRLKFDPAQDQFMSRCDNGLTEKYWNGQTIAHTNQQMLYLALRHAQHAVDLITEDDILDGRLGGYEVVHFSGEWVNHRVVPKLEEWVRNGGILYADAGLGHRNQFNEEFDGMLKLLGIKSCTTEKNLYTMRPYLELPLAQPIDTITLDGAKIGAISMRQYIEPADAKVLGTWTNGKPAVTVRELGKGKAFAVGTAAGNTYMKTGVRVIPFARGGRKTVYNPTEFDPGATALARLAVEARKPVQDVVCSNPFVEALVIDSDRGTLLTLVNWTNGPLKDLKVTIKLAAAPKQIRSVGTQKVLQGAFADGALTVTLDLAEADYLLLAK